MRAVGLDRLRRWKIAAIILAAAVLVIGGAVVALLTDPCPLGGQGMGWCP